VDGRESEVVAEHGRLFDLIVIGRTTADKHARWQATCEAALFESGRPVLLAPAQPPKSIGDSVVVAWNGSTETARSVALAMPLLTAASRVVVLSVEGWMIQTLRSGHDEPSCAKRRGGEAETVPTSGRTAGEAILEKCWTSADLGQGRIYTQPAAGRSSAALSST
jgi:hypothetical protein